jgi:hypothetical protein
MAKVATFHDDPLAAEAPFERREIELNTANTAMMRVSLSANLLKHSLGATIAQRSALHRTEVPLPARCAPLI